MVLEKTVERFYKQNRKSTRPLLLAFSGGEDSSALLRCFQKLKIPIHIAHFDHGWRKESQEQASAFQMQAASLQIPFHAKRSDSPSQSEEGARNERYDFFEKLFERGSFEALVLAHHQGDQVETLLKRVFELPRLTGIKGMKPISTRGGMPLWRPLLQVPKREILSYIKVEGLDPLDDPTNRDPKHLRSRMRHELIPALSNHFGKEIAPVLLRMGVQSGRLEDYLHTQTAHIQPIKSDKGVVWDFRETHVLEVEHILTSFFRGRGAPPSIFIIEEITRHVIARSKNIRINFSLHHLIVDDGQVTLLERDSARS